MKIWADDIRPAPFGYHWCRSVNETIRAIVSAEAQNVDIDVIDLDHDAGDYFEDGGDFIRVLDWMEESERDYPIRIHTSNPVGAQNMRLIIYRNGWEEL